MVIRSSSGDPPAEAVGRRSAADLLDRHGATLLRVAAASIEHGIRHERALSVSAIDYAEELRALAASFVTLSLEGRLRGCVGSIEAYRPLVQDVASNGFAAAFRDDRFTALHEDDRHGLTLSVSVLSPPEPLCFRCEADLLARLRPRRDGLIIRSDGCRALFLPQVWENLGEPWAFLRELKAKAGLPRDHWAEDFRAWRFETACVSTADLPAAALWS
jgi:AmmeMemoRadiSam system protein A